MLAETEHIKCLIIGSGPAGYTAAIYAARAGLQPVMYTGIEPGGQLTKTTEVENFPGYPTGITGPVMMEDFRMQALRFGTDIRYDYVSGVDFSTYPYEVTVDERKKIMADSIIISTGASAKWLGLESEAKYNGSGVSACAVCDGYFFRGKDVALVGAGDTAAEEAVYLSKLANKVYMLVRRDEFRASKLMVQRVLNTPNIEVLYNTETLEVLGDGRSVTGIKVYNNQLKQESAIPVTGFFVAIGHTPNTAIFSGAIDMDEAGYIKTNPRSTATNIPGVFCCGDAQDPVYRQAITAAGTGCMAALDAERFLNEREAALSFVIGDLQQAS
ncbi:thioredoxin-disulfide reductase [Chitinophaga pinensis]|uniref:Thioredoxin reductase n=1 Tax=Chitinophaga pinensis (strain ATCC 43595 / DSM 2588 / LMG 13176 / NBRC 15968 / NCIMB 11800 / UQM 2034) TaxID=485918 RepID=A0A979GUH2_CHIPD|nr:thioredoxin-disulfide reductase [Chitinophaga pinensis]ACU64522.1 thioredoxin reductase [Chitinophaga pinensis DSM 2588]